MKSGTRARRKRDFAEFTRRATKDKLAQFHFGFYREVDRVQKPKR